MLRRSSHCIICGILSCSRELESPKIGAGNTAVLIAYYGGKEQAIPQRELFVAIVFSTVGKHTQVLTTACKQQTLKNKLITKDTKLIRTQRSITRYSNHSDITDVPALTCCMQYISLCLTRNNSANIIQKRSLNESVELCVKPLSFLLVLAVGRQTFSLSLLARDKWSFGPNWIEIRS